MMSALTRYGMSGSTVHHNTLVVRAARSSVTSQLRSFFTVSFLEVGSDDLQRRPADWEMGSV